jgi:diguanylate cyclase (GGDEF)-like protein/PAS domain S-box-containing protein
MHPSLVRPIRRHFGDALPSGATAAVLEAASELLVDMERERTLAAGTMEVLSQELTQRLERVRAGEARYRMLFDAVPHPIFLLRRADRVVLDWNSAADRTLGWPREEVLGRAVDELHLCQMGCVFATRLMGSAPIVAHDMVETVLCRRDGHCLDVEVQGLDMRIGETDTVLVLVRDVSAQRAAERQERESSARFRAFFDYAGIAIQLLTVDGTITEVNPACRELFGYDDSELLGRDIARLLVDVDDSSLGSGCAEVMAGLRDTVALEKEFRHKDGRAVWAQVTLARVQRGDDPRLMAMLQDVTERKRMEAALTRQAFEDELTGLANRALFRDRLRHALGRRARNNADVAVLLLDLDGFKRVNDSLGHAAGDALLHAIAQRIAGTVRAGETVARLGGDEFAVVIEALAEGDDPMLLAERLLRVIARPVTVADREVVVGVSIGLAVAQPGEDGDAVLRNADTAMYSAKQSGKHCVRRFDPSMHARALVWLEVEQDLRRAIANHEFTIHFQPLLRLESGVLRGFEALVRWNHPRRGLVPPCEFLPVAEETGLIVPIGRWVLAEACRQAQLWPAVGDVPLSVSVNVAPRQLEHDAFVTDVHAALAASALPPGRLILEITESQIMRTPELAREKLQAVRDLGVRIAIDDFGTGYSSLSHLQFFPVDELKIDRTFVARLGDGEREASFVRTMVSLAQSLGVEVVAEGIELDAQRDFLNALGCETGQGFLFSRPMPAPALAAYLAAVPLVVGRAG